MIRLAGFLTVGAGVLFLAPAAGLEVAGVILGQPIPLTPRTWAIEACVMVVSNNHTLRGIIHVTRRKRRSRRSLQPSAA